MTAASNGDLAQLTGPAPKHLAVGITGAIAALNVPFYMAVFRAMGVDRITAVLTPAAERFLPASAVRHLCEEVYSEDAPGQGPPELGEKADRILVLPTTAHLLGCVAHGLAPTVLTSAILAAAPPVFFAPSMNPRMWHSLPVRRNVERIRADGHIVIDPIPARTYETASRDIENSLAPPPPHQLLRALTQHPAAPHATTTT